MLLFHDNKTAHKIAIVITLIALCHNLIVFIYHIYRTVACITKKPSSYMHKISLFTLSVIIIFNLEFFHNHWLISAFNSSNWICSITVKIAVIVWTTTKMSFYFFSLERLFCVFRASPISFSKYQIYTTRFVWIIIEIIYIVVVIIWVDGETHPFGGCITNMPTWIYVLGSCNDIFLSIIISVMFARRLLLLNTSPSSKLDDSLFLILKKSTLLTFIGLITTQFSLILCVIFGEEAIWISLDSMCNVYCIILMFITYNNVYKMMCAQCEKCITIRCLSVYSCLCCSCCRIQSTHDDGDKTLKNVESNSTTHNERTDLNHSL